MRTWKSGQRTAVFVKLDESKRIAVRYCTSQIGVDPSQLLHTPKHQQQLEGPVPPRRKDDPKGWSHLSFAGTFGARENMRIYVKNRQAALIH